MTKRQQKERLALWCLERAREHEERAFPRGFAGYAHLDRDEEIAADNLRAIAFLLRNGTARERGG